MLRARKDDGKVISYICAAPGCGKRYRPECCVINDRRLLYLRQVKPIFMAELPAVLTAERAKKLFDDARTGRAHLVAWKGFDDTKWFVGAPTD